MEHHFIKEEHHEKSEDHKKGLEKRKDNKELNKGLFLIGLLLVFAVSFLPNLGNFNEYLVGLMFFFGLIVGFMNITKKEKTEFFLSLITLLLISLSLNNVGYFNFLPDALTLYLDNLIVNFTIFMVGASLVVSVKSLILLAKD